MHQTSHATSANKVQTGKLNKHCLNYAKPYSEVYLNKVDYSLADFKPSNKAMFDFPQIEYVGKLASTLVDSKRYLGQ